MAGFQGNGFYFTEFDFLGGGGREGEDKGEDEEFHVLIRKRGRIGLQFLERKSWMRRAAVSGS